MRMIVRLPPRERQVAEIIYSRTQASATEVCEALPDALSNGAVRSMLKRLESKGVVRRRKDGKKFLYVPSTSDERIRQQALLRVSNDFFDGSLAAAAETLSALLQRNGAERRDLRTTALAPALEA